MMHVLIGIALKSLLVAGIALGLLELMKRRSAAERSWVAHAGLLALVVVAVAPLAMPNWIVEAPALSATAQTVRAPVESASVAPPPVEAARQIASEARDATAKAPPAAASSLSPVAATIALYAVPAAILLFITFLALARLVALRARAEVLVDAHWLSALAHAQRRMGFKHGTALLTSDELASPISWGLMRPVILLNTRAVAAAGEAEAIIAHELAHVARMDWAKLLLARVATALFWFNPLVWLLAREAHQLREEAADDAVLAADIPDTDYAQLLVGVARHECPGLLLGAHGVAPSKSSLARRVARVLDDKTVRGPVAGSFAAGVFVGAVVIATPLAALTLVPNGTAAELKQTAAATAAQKAEGLSPYYPGTTPTDLPSIISQGVATSVESAVAAINPRVNVGGNQANFETILSGGASVTSHNGITIARAPSGETVTVYPPDAQGRRKIVTVAAGGVTAIAYADAGDDIPGSGRNHDREPESALDRAIAMKAVGVTPQYLAEIKAASPSLRGADLDDIVGMKAVGVTPDFIRDMAAAGFPNLDVDGLTEAKAVGLTGAFIRAMKAEGYNSNIDDYVQMRAVGVTPGYAEQFKKSGYSVTVEKLVELKAQNVDVEDLRKPTQPPRQPRPPQPPRAARDNDSA
jgi:beta-lactamase regulating signal transducer with metallopeptidase domain